jgi:hypothetical protein
LLASLIFAAASAVAPAAVASTDLSCTPAELAGTGLRGPARLLPGMGRFTMRITTSAPEAQRFFDQGLVLGFGFNFAEAVRSFTEAARLDPQCAMCRWGIAWARGPSVNHEMTKTDAQAAFESAVLANALAPKASDRERALIAALAQRYAGRADAPRAPLDRAYAEAMRTLALQYPRDADVLTLAAEALMVPQGREYWTSDGRRQPWTAEIEALLARALESDREHIGALHYWIHVHEFGPEPAKALAEAERIGALAPGAGHLVHMPAHTFARLGRWRDAVEANRRAVEADLAYLRLSGADPEYAAGYIAHNYHFLWATALRAGDRDLASKAAEVLANGAAASGFPGPRAGTQHHFLALPLYTQVYFGDWAGLQAAPQPRPASAYASAVWHWGRGMGAAREGRVGEARAELRKAEAAARKRVLVKLELKQTNTLAAVLDVALWTLRAEIALAAGDRAAALRNARSAVEAEARLAADEPPAWHAPAGELLARISSSRS